MSKRTQPKLRNHFVNLEERHFSRIKHGFEVIGTWYQESPRRWKPCLAIIPAQLHGKRPVPCLIPLENAWIWAVHGDVGDPEEVLMQTAVWFDEGILPGQPFNKADHMKLLDAVNENLTDLIAMPPRPKGETAVFADVILKKETGEIIEREVSQDV